MSIDLRLRLKYEMDQSRKVSEAVHIIKSHGTSAWFDVCGFESHEEAAACLEAGLAVLIEQEDYENACILRDAIKPLKNKS